MTSVESKTLKQATVSSRAKIKAIIPLEDFAPIFDAAKENSHGYGCATRMANHAIRDCLEGIAGWWKRTNGAAPGLSHYEEVCSVLQNTSAWDTPERKLRTCFMPYSDSPAADAHRLMADMVRTSFRR